MARPIRLLMLSCMLLLALFAARDAGSSPASWSYVLPVDHGIRVDRSGRGHFLASRYHGRHNGIDLLAPVDTPVRAACSGKARSGVRGAFGRWVQLVCKVPGDISDGPPMYASLFHAHLKETAIGYGKWVKVQMRDKLGTVGKSGNAGGASVAPHLHFEIIVHGSRKRAMNERHSGRNQSTNKAADRFFAGLKKDCFEPTSFTSQTAPRRARRADPFMVLSCLTVDKPELTIPGAPLAGAARKWSSHYSADTFDVDVGRRSR